MPVQDFLNRYQETLLNKKNTNPLNNRKPLSMGSPAFGISTKSTDPFRSQGYGSQVSDWLQARTSGALDRYMEQKSERTSEIASDYSDKAAGQVPVDRYGIVQDKMTDFSEDFDSQLASINKRGKAALATEESRQEWQRLQNQKELAAGHSVNWTPGASGKGIGAKAVNLAMQAYKRGTPYVWGGNSLTRGVDCSGLVQQVYSKLGIKLSRTTYEQAKNGKRVSLSSLKPGDLLFYNTGSRDPNGIGSLSHVAIYIGNGRIVDARNSRVDMEVGSMNIMGGPAMAVRPW